MKSVDTITVAELIKMTEAMYENLVKAVVDIGRKQLVVDSPMHVDEEQLLLEDGSKQSDLWGINLYPDKYGTNEFIEFDSLINVRPRQNNRTRYVEDESIRKEIIAIVEQKVTK